MHSPLLVLLVQLLPLMLLPLVLLVLLLPLALLLLLSASETFGMVVRSCSSSSW